MLKKYKSFLLALLAAAAAVSQTSCGFIVFNSAEETTGLPEDTAELPETTTSVETEQTETTAPRDLRAEAAERLEELEYRNFSKSSVIIATAVSPELICPSGETDSEVIAARTLTSNAVEEKFNTRIIANPVSRESILEEAKEAYASDMYYADLIALPQTMVGSFYAAGILMNMNSLPFADYSQPYYYEKLNRAALLGDTQLAISGAASFDPDSLACVYFNRDKLGNEPYSLVTSGGWTIDKYRELAKTSSSIDGVSGHGSSFDREGYIDSMIASMGLEYVTNVRGQLPTLDYMNDYSMSARAESIVDKLYDLIFADKTYSQGSSLGTFSSGALLLYTGTLSSTASLADSQVNWGILPMPKFDAAQTEYCSPISDDSPVFCALANTPNSETSGLILEALNSASYEYVEDIYFSQLRDRYLRDNSSINMLEIILENPSSDFTKMTSSGFSQLAAASYEAVRSAVTSSSSLESIYRRYSSAAEKELSRSTVIY